MQHFDGELEKLIRTGVISVATAMTHATNANNLRVQLTDVPEMLIEEQQPGDDLIVRF